MSLSLFHPLIKLWFEQNIGQPTVIQKEGWPKVMAGEHVLMTAPTGSGKTLAAFLWAVNQLITGQWGKGIPSILYVSPLKALNNDIHQNLLSPLKTIEELFERNKTPLPRIRVMVRSGDTPPSERRLMLRHPPEILITTPESLNLLLSSQGGRGLLKGIQTVIMDEIHALAGNKRGAYLISAVDRLVPMSGEFQRIGLTATVRPLEEVARFMGGCRLIESDSGLNYEPRPVSLITANIPKRYHIEVRAPEERLDQQTSESIWKPIIREFKDEIGQNRSTLIFTNSRKFCETVTYKINYGEDRLLAYAHHGSLSREIREEVEQKLKEGDLKAIVATNSLELGIDIGALDEVILFQSPSSVSSAIQKIGRAGHQVGGLSRGLIFPTFAQDFLEAAVLARAVLDQDLESLKPVTGPLDVLAQIIVSMTGAESWDLDQLYDQLKTSYPFQDLKRKQFDLVIDMLGGRYADARLRELKPLIFIDRLDNRVSARRGALLTLYISGGVIPDRGYFRLRHFETSTLIGELDEEFVWEARPGQLFTLGTQNWKIERITHNDVFVRPAPKRSASAPFWKAEARNRDFHFSARLGEFLEQADTRLDAPEFISILQEDYCLNKAAAIQLVDYLKSQKQHTRTALPHRHHLLIEVVNKGPGSVPGNQVVLHTLWGGRLNHPLALAMEAAWEEKFNQRLEIYADNNCIALILPHAVQIDELLTLVTTENLESLLKKRLEGSGFYGARFRECAGRALLLARSKINERLPLWLSRIRSQKLLDTVRRYEDFPIIIETWRTCLQDEFEMENLKRMLGELENGAIQWSEVKTNSPSPMARTMSWRQINEYMYRDDTPSSDRESRLRKDLIDELLFSTEFRPTISKDIITPFEEKLQRLSPGYSPSSPIDLLDWIKERMAIPQSEWHSLQEAMIRDHGDQALVWIEEIGAKLAWVYPDNSQEGLIMAIERIAQLIPVFYGLEERILIEPLAPHVSLDNLLLTDPTDNDPELLNAMIAEWLRFYGPQSEDKIQKKLGLKREGLLTAIEDLVALDILTKGQLVTNGSRDDVCDRENFSRLLRMARFEARPTFDPLGIDNLPLFMAEIQGLVDPGDNIDDLHQRLEQLLGLELPAHLWESEILPARIKVYDPLWLDHTIRETDLIWIGNRSQRVSFSYGTDLDLLLQEEEEVEQDLGNDIFENGEEKGSQAESIKLGKDLLPDTHGHYDFSTLLQLKGLRPSDLSDLLWKGVWEGWWTNDSFASLRRGLETGFKVSGLDDIRPQDWKNKSRVGKRGRFVRWKKSLPSIGNWFKIPWPEVSPDLIDREERNRDRIRLLLDRYGLIFRELLVREITPLKWANLFRTMRLMELSGEIISGFFFEGISGPQFISHHALRRLQQKFFEETPLKERIWWLNAADPASLCGLGLEGLYVSLPRRLESTHLVYHGKRLVLVSERKGKTIKIDVPPEDVNLPYYLAPIRHLLYRPFQPMKRLIIEMINDDPAPQSPYLDAFRTAFDVITDYKKVTLFKHTPAHK